MSEKITPIPIEPIGKDQAAAFLNPGGLRIIDIPIYPKSEEGSQLRDLRSLKKITLRRAAELIGISAAELSDLESGRATLSLPDWKQVFTALEAA